MQILRRDSAKMLAIVLAVLFSSLLRNADGIENMKECPKDCNCQPSSFDKNLEVNCGNSFPPVDVEQFSRQLDSLLSDHDIVESLTSLTVTNTPLTRVPASICQLQNLASLHLDRNNLTELPDKCFNKLTTLVALSVSSNSIVGLQDGLFDGLQSLVSLDFSDNQIAFIGLHVFSNASDLTSLRHINLSFNKLTSLEPWWYYRCILGNEMSPVIIALDHNSISNFTNKLQFHFRCGMKKPYGYLDLYANQIVRLMDVLRGWNIGLFAATVCLINSRRGHPLMKFDVGGYWYTCDCVDFWFYKVVRAVTRATILEEVHCTDKFHDTSIAWQPKLAIAIPLIEFVCELNDRCPSRCRCVYRPANATLHVYCSAINLFSLPLDLPPLPKSYVRYKLDFSNNKLLRRLELRPYFANTSVLDVSNCAINFIDLNVWEEFTKMQSPFVNPRVILNHNKIVSLPLKVSAINLTSVHLSLKHNPWKCSCDSRWMIAWFKSLSPAFPNDGDVLCASPSRLEGKNIAQSSEDDFCVDPATRMLKISLTCTVIPVAVLLFTGFAVYRLRVTLYRRWKFHPFDRDECLGENMDYDVFLCCSSEDHNPHGLHILQLIESKGYKVCYHLRDFLAGEPIVDNMIQSIVRSKRTVCLLSNNFLTSHFCMTEFDMAYHHNVAVKRKKRLIVLMTLDSPIDLYANDASNTAALRQYLRQYTYIDYTADDWLDRLLYALPFRGLFQHEHTNNDAQLPVRRQDLPDDADVLPLLRRDRI